MRRDAEAGFTLVELLVAVTIAGVILTTLATAVINVTRTVGATTQRNEDLHQARLAVAATTRHLRTAVTPASAASPFVSIAVDGSAVEFYANTGRTRADGPARVRLFVDGSRLREEVTQARPGATPGTWQYVAADRRTRVLVADLRSPSVFTFFCDKANPQTPCSDPVGEPELIHSVAVRLSVRQPTNYRLPATRLETQVRLANATQRF